MLKQQTTPIYEYRGHLIVLGANGSAIVYRSTVAGEGSPRLNMLPAPDGYQAGMAWVDRQFPASSVRSRPTICRVMPRYIADDLKRPPGYYLIEHPTRGCFVGIGDLKARFRWSVPRSDRSIERFMSRAKADEALATIGVKGCYVVAMGG